MSDQRDHWVGLSDYWARGRAHRMDWFLEGFAGRFWQDFGHFRGTFRHFTGILSTFVPTFPQLWAPRGRRPQQGLKSAH